MRKKRLGEILVEMKYISEEQLREHLARYISTGAKKKEKFGTYLLKQGVVTEEQLTKALAKQHGVSAVRLGSRGIDESAVFYLPLEFVKKWKLLPVTVANDSLVVVSPGPVWERVLKKAEALSGCRITLYIAPEREVDEYLEKFVIRRVDHISARIEERVRAIKGFVVNSVERTISSSTAGLDKGVIPLVDDLIGCAVDIGSSDIHFIPVSTDGSLLVRYRVEGAVKTVVTLRGELGRRVIQRLKVMGNMDITEKDVPQDGRTSIVRNKGGGEYEVDIRISVVPSLFGEACTVRILDRFRLKFDPDELGMSWEQIETVRRCLKEPSGLVLVAGPPGSGKTTTLYSLLDEMTESDERIIATVEDPVEYRIPNSIQVQVKEFVGLTFPSVLRAFVRQDVDVIMVGEVRDGETADVVVGASLTGKLVLATTHSDDCASLPVKFATLTDYRNFVISLKLVIAQRLVRKLCESCRVEDKLGISKLKKLGLYERYRDVLEGKKLYMAGGGCERCSGTGYSGRVGVFEVVKITEEAQGFLLENSAPAGFRQFIRERGVPLLFDSAIQKVAEGVTSVSEVITAVPFFC